jgi:hypothetical protein
MQQAGGNLFFFCFLRGQAGGNLYMMGAMVFWEVTAPYVRTVTSAAMHVHARLDINAIYFRVANAVQGRSLHQSID